jgi:hypothetical protein
MKIAIASRKTIPTLEPGDVIDSRKKLSPGLLNTVLTISRNRNLQHETVLELIKSSWETLSNQINNLSRTNFRQTHVLSTYGLYRMGPPGHDYMNRLA